MENINFISIDSVLVEDVEQTPVYDIELDKNHYFAANGIISHNCRLLSDGEMLELAAQSNSFGAGSVGNLGSHRVATINFNRIALESSSYDDYKERLNKRMEDTRKILKGHKVLIKKLANHGLQMFISNGWVSLQRLFSTFGVMGLFEANLYMKERFGEYDGDFISDILTQLNDFVVKITKEDEGFVYNIEQIPGESYAVRLCNVDKLLFGEGMVPFELYANQWIPLWHDATIWEKLAIDGKYNQMLTGGGIVHATIGERVTSEQAKKIIEYAVNCGCEHFALNAIYSRCVNGHTTFGDIQSCPVCGDKIETKMTRVVGFLTPVQSWNKTRREWEFPRRTKVNLN